MIDTVGIIVGLLLANNEDAIIKTVCTWKYLNEISVMVILGIMCFLYFRYDTLLGRYQKPLCYILSMMSILWVIKNAYGVRMREVSLFTELAGISYFVYLIHVKVANIVYATIDCSSFVLSFGCTMILSFVLYKLNRKLF